MCSSSSNVTAATSVTSHAFAITAKTKGVVGDLATTETSAHLSFGAVTMEGGVNGTVAPANAVCADASYLYHTVDANTTADGNWRRISLGSVY